MVSRHPHVAPASAPLSVVLLAWACAAEPAAGVPAVADARPDAEVAMRDAQPSDGEAPRDQGPTVDAAVGDATIGDAPLAPCVDAAPDLRRPKFGVEPTSAYLEDDRPLTWEAQIESLEAERLVLRPFAEAPPPWQVAVTGDFTDADTLAGAAVTVYLHADFYNELVVTDAGGLLFAGTDSGHLFARGSGAVLTWVSTAEGVDCLTGDGVVRTDSGAGAGEFSGVPFDLAVGETTLLRVDGLPYRVALDSAFSEAWDLDDCDRCGETVISALRLRR